MTRTDEQLLFQTIDQIQRPITTTFESKTKNYEERLRASLNKLILPDWYNHEYTSINGLRKTKSQGHVPRLKRINENTNNNNNNNNPISHDESPRLSHSSHRPSYRHRSPSRSWSERPPIRRDSTSSSYDSTGHVLTTRRSYAPGVQRVAQSSTWYKPRLFPIQLPERVPPKPRPRQQFKIADEESHPSATTKLSMTEEIPPQIAILSRTNSNRSLTSEAESYRSAKNLPGTDSSSYASVNDRCLSPSTASYHTALGGETSSSTGYETPTPQLEDDDGTLSSQSSLSDLSRAETLEPTIEDLECVESTLVTEFPSVSMNPSATTVVTDEEQHLEPATFRPMENSQAHWYEGSLETCIPQTKTSNVELREISDDENLREIDFNAVGDEFFLFSPRDEDSSVSITETQSDPVSISPSRTSNRIFTMENQQLDFHYSSSNDPFGSDGTTMNNQTETTMMITNLDDIFMNEDDDQELLQTSEERFQRNYRRPIQEEILYEVEHENSFSDQSQNTSSIVPTDHQQYEREQQTNIDYLTSTKNETVPIYVLPPSLQINVENDSHHEIPNELTSPSYYTSKIRHRHYSVGSYYDHKSTSVTLQNNHPLYLLGSAPVSPLNRLSTITKTKTTNDSFYSHSPMALNPLMDVDEHRQISPQELSLKPTIRQSSVTFSQFSIPTPPPRTTSLNVEQPPVPPRMKTLNADLQFIRGAIERVFDFQHHPTDPVYEEISDPNANQYPAVEAIQRFYKPSTEPVTNLDDLPASQSSVSNQFYGTQVKTSEQERASSEEIDDTLNDIEDVDEHEDKSKRHQAISEQTSQETQTIEHQTTTMLNDQNSSSSSSVPPIEIVTELMIEQANPNAQIEEVNGDMIIFYDDIEIVEHSSRSYSSECDSASSSSSSSSIEDSDHYSKPRPAAAPPIPARTLKPSHLINHSTGNPTYELEKTFPKKKFDINSVNDMINRRDTPLTSSNPHRLPSARHFVGKLNSDDLTISNGNQRVPTKSSFSTLPARSSNIADTNALVKQIQSSLSRTSIHDKKSQPNLSTSSKDLRTFVSNTYSPSTDEMIDDRKDQPEDSTFKRQARLSKSYHNVSEYSSSNNKSKSVEHHLDQVIRAQPIALKLSSVVAATSAIEENPRMMSMKWYTGHVNENSEISYEKTHLHTDDLLHGYIFTHGNVELQSLLTRFERSNDTRVQTALDDIRLRVAEFDASKTQEDLPGFLKYLERRLRGINTSQSVPTSKTASRQQINEELPQFDTISNKSRTSSGTTTTATSSSNRQYGRQHFRSTGTTNGHHQRPIPPRRTSSNQENPVNAEDMYNTVLGLPKKSTGSTFSRERPTPLVQTQMATNTSSLHKANRDIGKRLFESGTLKDPRLIYDGSKKVEKEEAEEPLETSV